VGRSLVPTPWFTSATAFAAARPGPGVDRAFNPPGRPAAGLRGGACRR
jgi:hypothetical protein